MHHITHTSPWKYACNHVKAFFILFLLMPFFFVFFVFLFILNTILIFLLILSFLFKINTLFNLAVQVLHLIEHGFYNLHIGIHDWQVIVVRWLFMPFSYDFLVLTIKRMWHQNQEHVFKNHKQLIQFKHYIAQTSKVQKNSSSKLNKVHSHEIQIS